MLGSARASRVGDDALVIANLSSPEYEKNIKCVSARAPKPARGTRALPDFFSRTQWLPILLKFATASR